MQSQCKHVGSDFGLHYCWATCCHSIFVVRGDATLWNSQKDVSKYEESCITHMKVYQWMERFQSGRTIIATEDCSGHPTTSWTMDSVKIVNALVKRTDRLLSLIEVVRWTSAVGLHIASSMRALGITKFVQGGCQISINGHAMFGAMLWGGEGFCAVDCHRQWNMGATLWTCKQTSTHGVETQVIAQDEEIQKWPLCRRSDVDNPFNGLILKRYWDHWQMVNSAMLEEEMKPAMLFAIKTKQCWQKEFGCIVTLDLKQQQWPLKRFKNWNLSFSITYYTVQILPHLISIFSDRSGMHYVDADLQMVKRVKVMVHVWLCTTENILHVWHQESRGPK